MELEKNERINALFAFYQPLLTAKQNDYLQLYYADDYSLGEIATEFSVSRQAVYDKILEGYEQKLHLYAEFEARNQQADRIRDYVLSHYPTDQTLRDLIDGMENLEAK